MPVQVAGPLPDCGFQISTWMWSPLLMTQPLCPYPPVNPLKVIPVLAQDETLQVTTSVPGSPVQQAFHPAVRSRIRKYPVSAPETVFPMPRQRPVISVVDSWWNGRHMADMLPRLFFEHFTDTSFAAERDGELAGFLVGLGLLSKW